MSDKFNVSKALIGKLVNSKLSGNGQLNHRKVKESDAKLKYEATVSSIDKLVDRK